MDEFGGDASGVDGPGVEGPGVEGPGGAAFDVEGYGVEEMLGFGGSGEVWRARENASGDIVALKRLHNVSAASSDRLRREAALLATVRHDHVVRLRAVLATAQGLVLVLDYAGGGSLAGIMAVRGRLSAGEVVTIGAPLAQALADMHARGLTHGDITASNVVFDDNGKPMLADFGVARLAGEVGDGAATPGYADPARFADPPATGAAGDVHGLAAVCFAALAGVPPYGADDQRGDSLAALVPNAPRGLVDAIEAGLAAEAANRPDAAALGRLLYDACTPAAVRLVGPPKPVVVPVTVQASPRPHTGAEATERMGAAGRLPATARRAGRHRWSPRGRLVLARLLTVAVAVLLLGGAVAGGVGWAGHDRRASATPVPVAATGSMASGQTASGQSASGQSASGQSASGQAASGQTASGVVAAPPSAAPATSVPAASAAAAGAAGLASGHIDWTAVLGALDQARDDAFNNADPSQLADVYTADSPAWAADRATLGQLVAAGEHAQGLHLELSSVQVIAQTADRVSLEVHDTLAGYVVAGPGGAQAQSVAGRGDRGWTVVLTSDGSGWRIDSIAQSPQSPQSAQSPQSPQSPQSAQPPQPAQAPQSPALQAPQAPQASASPASSG